MSTHEDSVSDRNPRLYTPCPTFPKEFSTADLVKECDFCGQFYAACCKHRRTVCHHCPIVYTDGACMNNGKEGAVSGLGIAFGTSEGNQDDESSGGHQFAIPVDDMIDPRGRRTSQRAELLAAIHGLRKVCDSPESHLKDEAAERRRGRHLGSGKTAIVITTDSEYVVKGMTEWLPAWKENNLRRPNGQRPSNLDLFLSLDDEVTKRERQLDIKVMFWHIDRAYNNIADGLAKRGARVAARGDGVEQTVRSFTALRL